MVVGGEAVDYLSEWNPFRDWDSLNPGIRLPDHVSQIKVKS